CCRCRCGASSATCRKRVSSWPGSICARRHRPAPTAADCMRNEDAALASENAELRARLVEAEEMLAAIRRGEVDALVVEGPAGPRVFTLEGVDAESNRFRGEILAQVSDAVIATDPEQRIIYLNPAAERQYGVSAFDVRGRRLRELYQV